MKGLRIFVLFFILLNLSSLACLQSAAVVSTEKVDYSSDPVELPQVYFCEVIALEHLNVRGGPAVSWDIIRQLDHGDIVRVSRWWQGWAMIAAAEWVNGDYLRCEE